MNAGIVPRWSTWGTTAPGGRHGGRAGMVTRRGFIDGVSAAGAATLLGATPSASASTRAGAAVSDAELKARDAIRATNVGMRAGYAALKSELIGRLSPVIVVENDATGGKFTLIHGGSPQESVQPVPELFELAKSISHVPQGIFSTIAAYLSDKVPNLPNADRIDPHDLDMVAFEGLGRTAGSARSRLTPPRSPPRADSSGRPICRGSWRPPARRSSTKHSGSSGTPCEAEHSTWRRSRSSRPGRTPVSVRT